MNGAVSLVCAIASTVLVCCCCGVHVLAVSRLNIKVFSESKYIPWWRASEARALLLSLRQ
jgi:predicted membrane chloride channel (bestrophin family)